VVVVTDVVHNIFVNVRTFHGYFISRVTSLKKTNVLGLVIVKRVNSGIKFHSLLQK
jgi:hypothetical protein